jgi:imidazolonepropionase-like amidohydrolase
VAAAPTPAPVFITAVRVVDGRGGVRDGAALALEDGRLRVGDAATLSAPAGARRIDGTGMTALPGLVDCHVHLCMGGEANPVPSLGAMSAGEMALRAAYHAAITLRAGVTTVRDCGAMHGVDAALKAALRAGWARGPRLVSSARALCMTGGHGHWFAREADGPDDVRRAAREQLKTGAEWVKLIATGGILTPGVLPGSPQLTAAELRAAVEEAHAAGRRAAAHAQGMQGIRNAVEAGVDSVEHGIHLDDDGAVLMRTRGTFLVPTLVAPWRILEHGERGGIHPHAVQKTRDSWDTHRAAVRRARAAGVRIAMGTDAGTPFNRHGDNAVELELMVRETGFTPMEALVAATSSAAALLGLDAEIGALADGLAADVLVVRGNPLDDVSLLHRPDALAHVFQSGVEVVRA